MIRLYLDEDSMAHDLIAALRMRGWDVTTSREMHMNRHSDEEHLNTATQQGRVLFSFNRGDFCRIHKRYALEGKHHTGIIVANQQQYSVGETMRRILHLAAAKTSDDMRDRVEFLSTWG
ncbi:MAG: DUF5615 family PIN-like protein [Ignavibacteriae bacterium]|nr:DUF5615 family PIN-like protein [Ignavibacteriota bacterium]